MPSINRIRVNNVKYNFGTQFYDDFTMRLHGKNTLYDLANGGGKSVLMLLLLQNMIPNCTLDEKQPIEKLFRTGNDNKVIHSLIEWKLDDDSDEGYRYMTTGFCARRAKDDEEQSKDEGRELASIEYFNYCIFYREYNKNDIINLPLSKDLERISYAGLRAYLKELPHRDMSLKVFVFDRKGEYQQFISEYGIHESQWEIIRGINKTEGHVRTYFENNYKTTRKVVEDLLIEEIIEKAYDVKTSREDDGAHSMAKMLMDIKEQLAELAEKKKDISRFSHQIELIELLKDKVSSFLDLYHEKSSLTKCIADMYVTCEEFCKNDEDKLQQLKNKRDEKQREVNGQKKNLECLKVAKDKNELNEVLSQIDVIKKKISDYNDRLKELTSDRDFKEGMNEYLEYLEEKKKYTMNDTIIKNMVSESSYDEELLYTYVYNIKMRTDVVTADIERQLETINDELNKKEAKQKYHEKLLQEARVNLAIFENTDRELEGEINSLSGRLSDVKLDMHDIHFSSTKSQLEEKENEIADLKNKIDEGKALIENTENELVADRLSLSVKELARKENDKLLDELLKKSNEYGEAIKKFDKIGMVYGETDIDKLLMVVKSRMTDAILERETISRKETSLEKRIERLAEGKLIDVSDAAKRLIDYIETRHGVVAMYGMDYVLALPHEKQLELLNKNPELPYGVVVEDFSLIRDDANIFGVDTGKELVNIYDMQSAFDMAIHYGDNAFSVIKNAEYFTNPDTVTKLIQAENDHRAQLRERLIVIDEMISSYEQDMSFLMSIKAGEAFLAGEREKELRKTEVLLASEIKDLNEKIKIGQLTIEKERELIIDYDERYKELISDINKLNTIHELSLIIDDKEKKKAYAVSEIKRLKEELTKLELEGADMGLDDAELISKKKSLKRRLIDIENEWENNYKPYYNIDKEYDIITLSDDELKARFLVMVSESREETQAIEDKKALMDTLKNSMDRILRSIEKKGVSLDTLADYEFRNLSFYSDDETLFACEKSIGETKAIIKESEEKERERQAYASRLEGSIEHAKKAIEDSYGSFIETDASLSDIVSNLKNSEEMLKRLRKEADLCDEQYRSYMRRQGDMLDLYKDVKRIVTTNDIDTANAGVLYEDKDKLRNIFDDTLLSYDRNKKTLDKAKNELLKFKGNTAVTLDGMEVFELARTIREDVIIPDSYDDAALLVENLKSISEYIALEKDRVFKSLADMETIKENFEEQCLQRCLDVKTELDKLPKLSKILCDGESIQMVGLTIPYIKEEFRKQRMSDYIDRIVAQADDYASDKERIKFIRNSLSLKKLFGVIVTDMNAIKLSLYKRERIKEQSRYLKYEEAVGSTGQSQGIYIQFLISIINYISGMYRVQDEEIRTKTIFIDNPFGAAKDVYIWEPIFALLKANNVQLVVPARGATPAITGRFDVNYILGQQMQGNRQLTVVTDYTSSVNQQDVEYKDLEYEQVSFDFI